MSRSALALCLLAAVCGAAHPSNLSERTPDRIVGGVPVHISQFPWQVSLEALIYGRLTHFCGGSIISSNWVLTATHCIRSRPITALPVYVRAGSSYRETGGFLYLVANRIQHEYYDNDTMDYDIALLQLYQPIAFSTIMQPVILGIYEIVGGTRVNVSGWGETFPNGARPWQLLAITTTVVDRGACRRIFGPRYRITQRMVCAGDMDGTTDACRGDSGGALVAGNTQYGVVSFCVGCAVPGYPQVYTNVPALRSWITRKTGV